MVGVDATRIAVLRDVLTPTGWVDRTREFAARLRRATTPGGLLLVGTPQDEPWHMAAHLADEARYADLPQLDPTLLRWAPPVGAPGHLTVGLDRLELTRRGETVLVVAERMAPASLLERVDDARRAGATILALDAGDPELEDLAHEVITVPGLGSLGPTSRRASGLLVPASYGVDDDRAPAEVPDERLPIEAIVSMDVVQHLITSSAGELDKREPAAWRKRLASFLDRISGPPPERDE